MQRILLCILSCLLLSIQLVAQSLSPNAPHGYLVQMEDDTSFEAWLAQANHKHPHGFYVEQVISIEYKLFLIRSTKKSSADHDLAWLRGQEGVKLAQINHAVRLRNEEPNDPLFEFQWNLNQVEAASMWAHSNFGYTHQGAPIVLGILEPGGFDTEHEDLKSRIWKNEREIPLDGIDNDRNNYIDDFMGWNPSNENDDHYALDAHGTQVAGIASADSENGLGLSSIAWNAKLLLLSGNRFESQVISSYLYALKLRRQFNYSNGEKGALVVATNASFGISGDPQDFPIWCDMYELLGEAGILSVSAADNRPINTDLRSDMPTSCSSDYLITVTGVDQYDQFIDGQAFGPQSVDIAAPAVDLYTTAPENQYVEIKRAGNSFAAPHLTGAIGLMYSLPYPEIQENAINEPAATAMLMKSFLMEGAKSLPSLMGKIRTEGRLNLDRTYELMKAHFALKESSLEITSIFPNPFQNEINIDIVFPTPGKYDFRIFDLQSRLLSNFSYENPIAGARRLSLPLTKLVAGMYTLQVSGGGMIVTHKLVKLGH